MLQNVYISLPYIMAARTAGIDKIEEITSLSIYVIDRPLLSVVLTLSLSLSQVCRLDTPTSWSSDSYNCAHLQRVATLWTCTCIGVGWISRWFWIVRRTAATWRQLADGFLPDGLDDTAGRVAVGSARRPGRVSAICRLRLLHLPSLHWSCHSFLTRTSKQNGPF